ncbi:hypothetical protein CCACVL1_23104 [Corchorus capsularis]|uniref:Pentatricopeptide repeat-containing protein n=1 Tax=Corchorus capsularis TaxID=210143 RepID=A0A1R3GV61_COCAP|nr:hypothetical protein CCACVL1_23104 [Corchorus capsularis]
MATRAISKSKLPVLTTILLQNLTKNPITRLQSSPNPQIPPMLPNCHKPSSGFKQYHDGRPRELERQEETSLAAKVFEVIQKQDWYKPDVYLYKDLIIALAKCRKMDEAMKLWESMRKENLFPDSQTYTEIIRGFLRDGSPADAMNVYEDMIKSPDPPEELPFRILLKGLLPHPLLRNKVKKDFEELFPEKHSYDPPEEIFGRY